ncbi:hypothetical protein E2C01_042646 [Portunus trituberculatus]|uniref:RNA-directed DNA polymerase from mobile element jockey n=1 Tax=Portunus trituberculatus TaxID=210409 RepID=A0A5B7FMC0_PORTR|nr:hypothetical protein [Portunus trituberculatus]
MQVIVRHTPPSTNEFTGITPDIFMDGDLSSDNLPPPPHPSPLLFYVIHQQPSLTVEEDFTEPNMSLHCQALQKIIVHKPEIGRLLENLDVRKVMGPDGVSGWALKECKDQLLEPIWEIVTSSLKEGRVPMEWKRTNLISIFKGGKSTEPLNYRPVVVEGLENRDGWVDTVYLDIKKALIKSFIADYFGS